MACTRIQRTTIFVAAACIALVCGLLAVHPFLAVTKPEPARLLVVEAWIYNRPVLDEVVDVFRDGAYQHIIAIGLPSGSTSSQSSIRSSAELLAEELLERGIARRDLIVIPVPHMKRHRTYITGLCLQKWLAESGFPAQALNVFTIGVHARKSRLLFRKALGPNFQVGVIAGREAEYNRNYWWLSREGIRVVARNSVGYLYALSIAVRSDNWFRDELSCSR